MSARVAAIHPPCAIEGGRIAGQGAGFPVDGPSLPEVRVGDRPARVVHASPTELSVIVPPGLLAGRNPVRLASTPDDDGAAVQIAAPCATGLHQVDNPIFDRDDNLYVTYSGTRGQQVPVSIFRVRPNGTREPFSTGLVNPTSLAVEPEGRPYVSNRVDGLGYRVAEDGSPSPIATDLGVACGVECSVRGNQYGGHR